MSPILKRVSRAIPALTLTLLFGMMLAQTASAAMISPGAVDWGIKTSLRSYVLGPAQGSITTTGGVGRNPDGGYKFPISSGTFDALSGETKLNLAGSLRLYAQDGAIDITLRELRIVINLEGAVLLGDVERAATGAGGPKSFDDIPIVALDISSPNLPQLTAGATMWPYVPTTLTGEGVPAFGDYPLGTAFDPITISYTGPGGRPVDNETGELEPSEHDVAPVVPRVKSLSEAKRLRSSSSSQRVVIATINCGVEGCVVDAPEAVHFKIRGKRYRARIAGRAAVPPNETGTLAAIVPAKAIKALRGSTATLRLNLKIEIEGITYARTAKVRIYRVQKL